MEGFLKALGEEGTSLRTKPLLRYGVIAHPTIALQVCQKGYIGTVRFVPFGTSIIALLVLLKLSKST